MSLQPILFLLLGIDALVLFLQIPQISISYAETKIVYGDFSFLKLLVNFGITLFGHNDFGLRFMMIFFHIASNILLYRISSRYIKEEKNRLWILALFMLLPGVVSSALVVNSAGVLIFGLLLFIYMAPKMDTSMLMIFLAILAVIDHGFLYLLCTYTIFTLVKKNYLFSLYTVFLVGINIFIYGIDLYGAPKGHFLDTIGVYSAIFSPIIFIYIIYSLYRKFLSKETDLLWHIATIPFLYSLIISFRQQMALEYYAPYLLVSLPLAAQVFISSYRVRLRQFRKGYKFAFILAFTFVSTNALGVLFNKGLYLILKDPQQHFAYDMHIAKDLAESLKSKGIRCVDSEKKMTPRLQFYNIASCPEYTLLPQSECSKKDINVTIRYVGVPVYQTCVTKVHNK